MFKNALKVSHISLSFFLFFAFTIFLAYGCGGEEEKDCSLVQNPCEELSKLSCNTSGSQILVCQENEDGCLQWGTYMDCQAEGKICDDTGEQPTCKCNNTCPEKNQMRCQGTAIQTCEENEHGCLGWVTTTDCKDENKICDDSGLAPQCVQGCTDECNYVDETGCDGTQIQTCAMSTMGCLEWVAGTDCADTGQICEIINNTATCVSSCTDECTQENSTRCKDTDPSTIIEICQRGTDGCLHWSQGINCADENKICFHDSETGLTECRSVCTDECPAANETRCNLTVIEKCEMGSEGCLVWNPQTDCATSGLRCDDTSEPATCVSGSGESCSDIELITTVPFTKTGTDFTADYSDDMAFTDSSCEARSSGQVEAVFAIDLMPGQELYVQERGGLDAVVSLQSTCGSSSPCIISDDFWYDDGPARYTASSYERIYIIIEALSDSPWETDYEIYVDIVPPENCGDGNDNDLDTFTDCDDSDCFGNSTYCTTETNCNDGNDNDGDGTTDCNDSDCSSLDVCQPYKGYWQEFGSDEPVDLTNHSIIFQPAPSDVNLYTWTSSGGTTSYPVTPGTGTVSTQNLSLTDDSYSNYSFGGGNTFNFFRNTYSSMFIGSNGFITFGEGDTDFSPSLSDFFDTPRIATFWRDLNPSTGGTVTVDEFSDRIVITFDSVPRAFSTQTVSFQTILHFQSSTTPGVIEFHYLGIQVPDSGMVGIGNGVGNGTYPSETNFI